MIMFNQKRYELLRNDRKMSGGLTEKDWEEFNVLLNERCNFIYLYEVEYNYTPQKLPDDTKGDSNENI